MQYIYIYNPVVTVAGRRSIPICVYIYIYKIRYVTIWLYDAILWNEDRDSVRTKVTEQFVYLFLLGLLLWSLFVVFTLLYFFVFKTFKHIIRHITCTHHDQ